MLLLVHEDHFLTQLVLFDLSLGVVGGRGLPCENADESFVGKQLVHAVEVADGVEIVVEIGDDQHDNEVRDDVKLGLTVGQDDVDVADFDD